VRALEWNLFNYLEILEKPKEKEKYYTDTEYREYIQKHFKATYQNKVFFNILLSQYFHDDWFKSKVTPKEQFEYFMKLYDSFTYHYQNDDLTVFSLKYEYDNSPAEYSLFISVKNDFIVELPRVKDLFNDIQCAPACAVWWFNQDGTQADMGKYLNLTEEEKEDWKNYIENANEIINPKDTNSFSYSEWRKDRREYYFFKKIGLHKFGKPNRVFDKHISDWFSDYQFTLKDMIYYLTNKEA
jgi:hypothetical protein